MEKSLIEISNNEIKSLIYEIRGKQVILDSDVARFYDYETKKINQTVKRNIKRFPEEFCFQLTNEEMTSMNLRSQNVTSNLEKNNSYGGRRYLPYVFTEQGIAMLSGLLKNDIAIEISIKIMKAFVEMRKFISVNNNIFEKVIILENMVSTKFLEHDRKFEELFNLLQKDKEFNQKIFFEGQIYDSYSLLIDIIKDATKEIIIIDNYADKTILDLLSKKNDNVEVTIITSKNSKLLNLDIIKFNDQYPKLKIEYSSEFHDRFIIIDSNIIYHCGASLKDLGKKTFGINKIEDKRLLEKVFISNKKMEEIK